MSENQPGANYYQQKVFYSEKITDALSHNSERKGVARYFIVTDKDPDNKIEFGVQLEDGLVFVPSPSKGEFPQIQAIDTNDEEKRTLAQELTQFLTVLFRNI